MLRNLALEFALKLRTDTMTELQRLEELSHATSDRLEHFQQELLYDILIHAHENTEYYNKQIPSNIVETPRRSFSLNFLNQIDPLEKDTLRSDIDRLISTDHNERESYTNRTGGSTGKPVEFLQDEQYLDSARAVEIIFDRWSGYELGEKKIRLWGSERDLFKGSENLLTRSKLFLKNEKWLNSFQMTRNDMHDYVNKINSFEPVQLLGYVDSTYEISKFIEENELEAHSPKSIMTSAGKLYPHMREKIESVFQTSVYNRYGSREMGGIASECSEHNGLHISPFHIVEVVDENGNHVDVGEMGEVLITSLKNYSMPMIRYRIGDMAVWGGNNCPCDCPWPILEEVSGRKTSMFRTPNGGIVSPIYFIHLIGVVINPTWIEKFQVHQTERDQIIIKVLSNSDPELVREHHSSEIDKIKEKIKVAMGDSCEVHLKFVSQISPNESGKYRYAISDVE